MTHKRYTLQLCLVDDANNRVAEHTFQTCFQKEAMEEIEKLHNIDIKQELTGSLINEVNFVLIENNQLPRAIEDLIDQVSK